MLSCGSQNAISTNKEARDIFVIKEIARLITLSWGFPGFTDWKSVIFSYIKRV